MVRHPSIAGNVVTYKATATDKAGNQATAGGRYQVRTMWLAGSSVAAGCWQVKAGKRYTLTVLSATRPTYYFATKSSGVAKTGRALMRASGKDRWVATFAPTAKMARTNAGNHNVGVKIGTRVTKVPVHVRR
jgi:hypothetical protein